MHSSSSWRSHRRARRRARTNFHVLQQRDPSLIELPFPIPSIPILDPLLTPLIGGEPWPSATSVSTEADETSTSAVGEVTTTQVLETTSQVQQTGTQVQETTTQVQESTTQAQETSSNTAHTTASQGSTTGTPTPQTTVSSAATVISANTSLVSIGIGGGGNSPGSEATSLSSIGILSISTFDTGHASSPTAGTTNHISSSSSAIGTDVSRSATGGVSTSGGGSSSSSSHLATAPASSPSVDVSANNSGTAASSTFYSTFITTISGHIVTQSTPVGTLLLSSISTAVLSTSSHATGAEVGASDSGVATLATATSAAEALQSIHSGDAVSAYTMSSASNFIAGASAVSSQATLTSTYSPYSSAGSVSGSGPDSGHSSSGGEPSFSSSGPASSTAKNHQLSKGAIAALATLGFILLLVLGFLLLRRRGIARRLERRRRWLFGRHAGAYGNAAVSSSRYFHDHPDASTSPSQRSSFGTGTDLDTGISSEQRERLPTLSPGTNPRSALSDLTISPPSQHAEVVPEMEEVWLSNLDGSIAEPALAATIDSDPLPTIRSPERDSWENERAQSEAESLIWLEWPAVPDNVVMNQRSPTLPTSISVRPSPSSEKCSFPTPTQDHRPQSVKSVQSTRESINAASTDEYVTAPENPFSDLAGAGMSLSAETSTEDGWDAQTANSFLTADPETASHFARVETIRRPFVPTMDDEMSVMPGETVRMLLRYDDGWAYAERVGSGRRGLIPIDCLRMPEEDLPAFLASKRLSSYSVTHSLRRVRKGVEIDARTMIGKAL